MEWVENQKDPNRSRARIGLLFFTSSNIQFKKERESQKRGIEIDTQASKVPDPASNGLLFLDGTEKEWIG